MRCSQKTIDLMKRAKQAGYNGIFVADSKFAKFQLQEQALRPQRPQAPPGVHRRGNAVDRRRLPDGLRGRVPGGRPEPGRGHARAQRRRSSSRTANWCRVDDTARLVNGSFGEWKGDSPVGWTVDQPGTVSFRDDEVKCNGKPTLRQEHSRRQARRRRA